MHGNMNVKSVNMVKSLYYIKYLHTQLGTFSQVIELLYSQFRMKCFGVITCENIHRFMPVSKRLTIHKKDFYQFRDLQSRRVVILVLCRHEFPILKRPEPFNEL
jgi:hypothetical protein